MSWPYSKTLKSAGVIRIGRYRQIWELYGSSPNIVTSTQRRLGGTRQALERIPRAEVLA
jgi:hypothetical protein